MKALPDDKPSSGIRNENRWIRTGGIRAAQTLRSRPGSPDCRSMSMDDARPTIVMAGATGSVGTALRHALAPDFRVIGLTRSASRPETLDPDSGTIWKRCDLFSLLELERALAGADFAIYLVHSMMPSARLRQGTFADLDLIMADNFARAAQSGGIRQIICLSALVSRNDHLSPHLASRLEVEHALGSGASALTTLRAGLIVGPGGSSLRIFINRLRRLPVMLLPQKPLAQPIAIDDVIRAVRLVLGRPAFFNDHFDIGGPDILSYLQILEHTARVPGRRRLMIHGPFLSTTFAKCGLSLLGGVPRKRVGPVGDNLNSRMVAEENPLQEKILPGAKSFPDALRESIDDRGRLIPNPRRHLRKIDDRVIHRARRVRSVQRLPLPESFTARLVAEEYFRWLPSLVRPLLRCEVREGGRLRLCLGFTRWLLVEFSHAPTRSSENRQLYYITGGVLARTHDNEKGRIEFREMLDRRWVLTAIHDYTPKLPWYLYSSTQALIHLLVMRRFGRHLGRIREAEARPGI